MPPNLLSIGELLKKAFYTVYHDFYDRSYSGSVTQANH